MEAGERTFRHSFGKVALMFLGVLFLGYIAFSIGKTDSFFLIMAGTGTGIAFVIALFYATSSVRISNEEITTSRLLGSKSLRWSEIARVSMRAQSLRLHNRDEDLTLSIDSQLDDYREILDIIFSKRSDLFDEHDPGLSSGWLLSLFIVGFGLCIIAVSVFLFFVSEEFERIFSLILFALGVFVILYWFLSPKRLTLESKSLIVGYLFKEVSYSAEEIQSVSLEKRRTREGYVYLVQINLKSGKKIRPPTFKQGSTLTYQILRRWHQRATSIGST